MIYRAKSDIFCENVRHWEREGSGPHTQGNSILTKPRVVHAVVSEIRVGKFSWGLSIESGQKILEDRNSIKIQFYGGGKKLWPTFNEARSPQFSYLTALKFFIFTGLGNLILVVLKGKDKFSGYVYSVLDLGSENGISFAEETQEDLLNLDQNRYKIVKVSELDVDVLNCEQIYGGFFFEERLIGLAVGEGVIVWRVGDYGEEDRYWRVRIAGLTKGLDFRTARYDRVNQLLWYHGGVREANPRAEEITECGVVDLKPIKKNLGLFKKE